MQPELDNEKQKKSSQLLSIKLAVIYVLTILLFASLIILL